jgi:hypothetical protein
MGNSYVSELDTSVNTCIKQKVPLQPGRALLEFDWAGRKGSTNSAAFEVKLNGQLLDDFQPRSDNKYEEDLEFKLA